MFCRFSSDERNRGLRATPHPERAGPVRCWTGQTVAEMEIPDVPLATLYHEFADLSRMTEWSLPQLEPMSADTSKYYNTLSHILIF